MPKRKYDYIETYIRFREYVREKYPEAFPGSGHAPIPLKTGIDRSLNHELKGVFSRKEVSIFLSYWTGRMKYKAAVASGDVRVNLAGRPRSKISKSHRGQAVKDCARYVRLCEDVIEQYNLPEVEFPDPVTACTAGSFLNGEEMKDAIRKYKRMMKRRRKRDVRQAPPDSSDNHVGAIS